MTTKLSSTQSPPPPPPPPPPPRGTYAKLEAVVASDNFRWIATSLVIPFSVFLWGQYAESQAAHQKESAEKMAKIEQDTRLQIADKELKARQAIENTQRNIDLVIRLLPDLNREGDSRERLNALAIVRTLEADGKLSPELRAALEANIDDIRDKLQPGGALGSKADIKVVETLARSAPTSVAYEQGWSKPATLSVPGTKVYIQIFDEAQRAVAESLQRVARELGIAAPGVENVAATSAAKQRKRPGSYDSPVLVVFNQNDLALAHALADKAEKQTGFKLFVRDHSDRSIARNVPAGQLEIWMTDPLKTKAASK